MPSARRLRRTVNQRLRRPGRNRHILNVALRDMPRAAVHA